MVESTITTTWLEETILIFFKQRTMKERAMYKQRFSHLIYIAEEVSTMHRCIQQVPKQTQNLQAIKIAWNGKLRIHKKCHCKEKKRLAAQRYQIYSCRSLRFTVKLLHMIHTMKRFSYLHMAYFQSMKFRAHKKPRLAPKPHKTKHEILGEAEYWSYIT